MKLKTKNIDSLFLLRDDGTAIDSIWEFKELLKINDIFLVSERFCNHCITSIFLGTYYELHEYLNSLESDFNARAFDSLTDLRHIIN